MMRRRLINAETAGGWLFLGAILAFIFAAIMPLTNYAGMSSASLLFDNRIASILRFTLWQAGLSTLLSVVLAIPLASTLSRRRHFPGRVWLIRMLAAPMGLPALAGAFGILAVWGRQGVLNDLAAWVGFGRPLNIYGLSGILIAHVFFNLPLAARLFLASLERMPPQYWKLSASIGMESATIFKLVEWPIIRRALPGVAGLVFMLCATSFTLVLTLGGGPAATTLEVAVYQALKFDFDPSFAVALSLLQVGIMAIILSVLSLIPRIEEERLITNLFIRRFDGRSLVARALDAFVVTLFLAFCGSPFLAIAVSGIGASFAHLLADPLFWRAFATSLAIGLSAALISVTSAYFLALARYDFSTKADTTSTICSEAFHLAGSLVLVLPPVVLATGWFLLLRGSSGIAPAVLVTVINALMALPFTLRALDPAVRTHRHQTSRLAQSLGLEGWSRWRIVDLPALKRPLAMATAFGFALSLGDLGAVALFGGNQLATLPWLMFARLGSYRTTDAAALAFILTIICLTLAILGTPGTKQENAR